MPFTYNIITDKTYSREFPVVVESRGGMKTPTQSGVPKNRCSNKA